MKSQRQGEQTNYDFTKPFAEQVDDWIEGKFPKNDTLLVGSTPKVFKDVGFNSLPVTLNQSHVDYAINGTKNADHTIGATLLKQLPQALENPVAIIASATREKTSTVALLPFTLDGNTVVAPVYVDGFGVQNNLRIDSNAVTSIYGRKNAVTTLLTDAINAQNKGSTAVFYLDTQKAAALYSGARVTMPKMPSTSRNGVVAMITDPGSPVKTKFSNVTETQQFKRWFGDWQNDPANASKVVNEDGTPKVVYHGTNEEFTVFDLSKSGKNYGETSEGLFFFTNKRSGYQDSASDYAEAAARSGGKAMVGEYYLSIKNPLRLYSDGYYTPTAYFDRNAQSIYEKYLSGDDYDGIIIENRNKNVDDSVIYLLDNPNQIKSATDNIGTFDSSNPDIRYSSRQRAEYDSVSKQFSDEIAQWAKDGQDGDRKFILGSTGEVLQGLGAIESDIYMNSDKINTILAEHPEITLEEIRQIPKIINDPILVLKSRNVGRSAQNTRMTMFGSVKGQNGETIPYFV